MIQLQTTQVLTGQSYQHSIILRAENTGRAITSSSSGSTGYLYAISSENNLLKVVTTRHLQVIIMFGFQITGRVMCFKC